MLLLAQVANCTPTPTRYERVTGRGGKMHTRPAQREKESLLESSLKLSHSSLDLSKRPQHVLSVQQRAMLRALRAARASCVQP
eukprot:1469063-Amphidinium_carterae.1